MSSDLKGAIDQLGGNWERWKDSATSRIESLQDRVESIEAEAKMTGAAVGLSGASRDELEHKQRFVNWMRDPHGHAKQRELVEAESELSKKSVTIGTATSGGYAVPAVIEREIERRVQVQNPFRSLVKVVTVGTSSYTHLVSKNDASSGWIGEGGSRTETTTSDLVEVAPTFGILYARPKASEEAVQDIQFDVADWLVSEVSDSFAAAEAAAIWSGNGTSKPSGLINTTPVSTADNASPERAATALRYLPITGPASPLTINFDSLVNLVYSIDSQYLTPADGVAFVMRRSTAAVLRTLKGSDNNYLWQPSAQAGQPDSILGYPVVTTDAVDAMVDNAHPIAFGSFRRGYLLAVRQGLRITLDDNITTPGQVIWYVRQRVGGKVLNNNALRVLKLSES